MPGPAAAGVLIYAKDFQSLAGFYEQVLGMRRLHEDAHVIVLESAVLQLVIHALPAEIAAPAIADAESAAQALGGQVFDERWQGPGFAACNAMDREGNVFQLRETLV